PFFTTKEQGKGTGLGLASVYGMVKQQQGAITVYSELNTGTAFNMIFPLSKEAEALIEPQAHELIMGTGCILVIDDESVIRQTATALLTSMGYTVLVSENGRSGFELYQDEKENIDLVLLDMVMPQMNGLECFNLLIKENPDIKVILSSGYLRDADISDMKEKGLKDFIRKPYRSIELSQKIAGILKPS
ncbi:MAG: response regulator, partial [Lentisphaeria bacterium]|nr:response regulator [Lentisphaeria bacterium]